MALSFVKRWLGKRRIQQAGGQKVTAAKRGKPSFFRPTLELLEDRTLLSQVSQVFWTSTQSGFWDVGSNWNTGKVPTASDDVTINQPGVTVTVRDAEAAGTLSGSDALTIASGGSLNIANASTFGGNVSVSSGGPLSVAASTTLSGNLSNAGTLTVQAGTLTVSGNVSQVSGTSLTGGTWNVDNGATLDLSSAPNLSTNAATVSLSGTGTFTQLASITSDSGSLSLVNGANFSASGDFTISGSLSDDTGQFNLNNHQLTISSGGTLSVGNASGLTNVSQVTNAGTFQVFAGTATMTLGTFNNQGGTIDVESGILQTTNGSFTGGTFIVKPQAVYEPAVNGGVVVWTGTFTGSGGGTVLFTNPFGDDTLQIGTSNTDTATFDFPNGMFQFQAGSIIGPGTLINAQGGFLSLTGSNSNMLLGNNNPVLLDNKGTILQTSTGTLVFGIGAVLDNESTGVYNFQAAGSFGGNNGFNNRGTVNNQGTFEMAGSGTSSIPIAFNNQGGTIDVESGTLQTTNGSFTGGTFIVKPQAVYEPAAQGATTIWTGTFTGSGGGTVLLIPTFGDGTIQIGTTSTDTVTFDFPSGMFQWQGGNIIGPGTLTNSGDMQLAGNGSSNSLANGVTLINTGTMTLNVSGGFLSGDSTSQLINRGIVHWINGILSVAFLNDRNATLSMEGDAEKVLNGGKTIDNRGTIDQGGNGTLSLGNAGPFGVSSGALSNEAGAVYDFTGDGSIVDALGTGFFNNAGEVLKTGGTGTSSISIGTFTSSGTIEVNTGETLELDSGTYAGTFT